MRKSKSLFRTMMQEWLLYTLATLVITVIFIFIIIQVILVGQVKYFETPYNDHKEVFEKGKYATLDYVDNYGEDSYLYVFDENKTVVFSSGDARYPYSYEETLLLPDESFKRNYGSDFKVNDKTYEKIEFVNEKDETQSIVIVDDKKNVLYSSIEGLSSQLTEHEYVCIKGRTDAQFMAKANFMVGGKKYMSVFVYPTFNEDHILWQLLKFLIVSLTAIVLAFIICLVIYIYRMNRKIKKPIMLLEEAIQNFDLDEPEQISYKGPREFKVICDKFNELIQKLSEIQAENKQIIADISHDLKTPLSVIQLYSEMVRDGVEDQEKTEELLNKIVEKSNEVAQLVSLFAEYSKLQRDDFHLDLKSIDLNEYCREYLTSKYNDIEVMGHELDVEISDDELMCLIDEFHLKRVFDNILFNSVKHNKEPLIIFFSVIEKENQIEIHLADTGKGIDEAFREKIFDAFSKGDASRSNSTSTGLGMAISKKIVSFHEGTIELLDESDFSTEFVVRLPK